ncbi:MAG: putative HTH-type transcriptional regulator [Methyloceanibacter sp.]|nr:MAG: putative HTH-type transcriptional regulator [Methyloceanibacter sp.]
MLSVTGEYALRAMVYLAENIERGRVSASRIAAIAGVPRKYLSAILADLVRAGLLDGTRGRSGGFQMKRAPRSISLAQVVAPFEPVTAKRKSCPFGNQVCSDTDPCFAHERWKAVKAAYARFLEETTLGDVAAKASGRCARGRN